MPKDRPAVGGSLFENNAEYGLGIWLSVEQQRTKLAMHIQKLMETTEDENLKAAAAAWLENREDAGLSRAAGTAFKNAVEAYSAKAEEAEIVAEIRPIWII